MHLTAAGPVVPVKSPLLECGVGSRTNGIVGIFRVDSGRPQRRNPDGRLRRATLGFPSGFRARLAEERNASAPNRTRSRAQNTLHSKENW